MIPARLLTIAGSQHGAISLRQLRDDVGMSASSVSRASSDGRLIRTGGGLFRLASHGDTFLQRCWSATLFGDDVGFISGTSAGRLYGLRRMSPTLVEYTVPNEFRRSAPGWMTLRYTNWYHPNAHRRSLDGLGVASPLRMLFGIAARVNQHRFDLAADDERVARQRAPSQSYLERDLIVAVEKLGIPAPERQYAVILRSGELIHLDLAWPAIRLAVEPGHSYFHGVGGGQERDHRRDAACAEIGWQILRLNEQMLVDMHTAARLVADVHRQRARDVHAA